MTTQTNRYSVEEFYGAEGDEWCVFDNEAELPVSRHATREEAETALLEQTITKM